MAKKITQGISGACCLASLAELVSSMFDERSCLKYQVRKNGQVSQRVKALTALAESPSSIPSTHTEVHNICNYTSSEPDAPFWSLWELYIWYTYIY